MPERSVVTDEVFMRMAIAASVEARGRTSPNPPVGAILVDSVGEVVGSGHTQPPGHAHAEVMAIAHAGDKAQGTTAYVTLEPCNHKGRTGPCAQALIAAGVAEVVYAVADPNPLSSGGSQTLESAGITVRSGVLSHEVQRGPLREWLHTQHAGRPHVTWKFAATMDGRSAAEDGSSKWITGPEIRETVHHLRSEIDAIVAGTGTVLADNPQLTARYADGSLRPHQPKRFIVGLRDIPEDFRVFDASARTVVVKTRDPWEVMDALKSEVHVLLEGGPTLASAFLRANLVDVVYAHVAPALLGSGFSAVSDLGVRTLADTYRFTLEEVRSVGGDLWVQMVPRSTSSDT